MKKLLLISLFCLSYIVSYGQEFPGVHSSQHFPLQNIRNQPAGLINDTAKWNINILTTQLDYLMNTDLSEGEIWDKIANAGFSDISLILGSEKTLAYAHGLLMLPSVSYKLDNKNSFALWFNFRADGIYSSSNSDLLKLFNSSSYSASNTTIDDENFKGIVNAWMEYNLSYSRLIWNNGNHSLAAGISLKILQGSSSGYFNLDGVELSYNSDRVEYFRMTLSYAMNESLNNAINTGETELLTETGFGFDIGFSYSYLPTRLKMNKEIPYKLKAGFIINDIGTIEYNNKNSQQAIQVSILDVPYSRFNGITTFTGLVDSIKKSVSFQDVRGESFRVNLPTKYTITSDYNIQKNWFIHGQVSYIPNYYTKIINIIEKGMWSVRATPRFENKSWGVYLPIGWNSQLDWQVGLGLKWKYIYLGSGTVLSNLFVENREIMQVYFGTNIPLGKIQ